MAAQTSIYDEKVMQHSDDQTFVKPPTYLLTTIDNPFHPLHEYDNWLRYDEDKGYYTQNYLARVAGTSDYLTEAENQRILNDAIDEICRLDILGIYKRIILDE